MKPVSPLVRYSPATSVLSPTICALVIAVALNAKVLVTRVSKP